MKKALTVLVFVLVAVALAWSQCVTIKDGVLLTSTGEVIRPGYDEFGYNYQAHLFNGRYCDYDRIIGGPYCDVELVMKWNDAWLSNKSCDGDLLLDRHFGYPTAIGSGAWCTNHQSGKVEVDGKLRKWTYFVKIVAVTEDAVKSGDYWYTPDGVEIGPVIWGDYAKIQQVSNDPSLGEHGILYKSPVGPGFGKFVPKE